MTYSTGPSSHPKDESLLNEGIAVVHDAIRHLLERVRTFYYEVVIFQQSCPRCEEMLEMIGPSRCRCVRGHNLDPTVAFQESECCSARLNRRIHHYACTQCGQVVRSRFLFDEQIFDAQYFSEKMREARERKQRKRDDRRELSLASRSLPLSMGEFSGIAGIDGLAEALNEFVGVPLSEIPPTQQDDEFNMNAYRRSIQSYIEGVSARFSAIPKIGNDPKTDRARRFVTLIFMEHEREVTLTQYNDDLLVEAYEADVEG